MNRPRYYARDGSLLLGGTLEWARLLEDESVRRVAFTKLPSGAVVSTVWLGLDHNFGAGPPLIFETMVFGLPDGEEPQERYSTETEALAGHKAMCAKYESPLRGGA
mgnify:CR=1 FL=1